MGQNHRDRLDVDLTASATGKIIFVIDSDTERTRTPVYLNDEQIENLIALLQSWKVLRGLA